MVYLRNERGFGGTTEPSARVFLAGGQPSDRRMMARLLGQQGCTVAADMAAGAALAGGAGRVPDMVAILAEAGGDGGFEICRNLRANESTESVPVLLVCGRETSVDWLKGMSGVFDVVRQPCGEEDLLVRVRLLLKLRRLDEDVQTLRRQLYTAQKLGCIGALTAGVAHEFNNLMCAVMGFAEMAKDKGGTDLEALRESADISYDTAKRAAATAATLLAFCRSHGDQRTMGNVNDVIRDAVRLLRKNMESTGVTVTLNLGDVPLTQCAVGPLQQVFLNLIINAWHAMLEVPGERLLSVSTRCEDGSRIVAAVRDTGVGIAAEDQVRIFDPFYTTKTGKGGAVSGSGLGLPLVLGVIKDHGGTVQVESTPGQGACFTVSLPVQASSEPASVESAAAANPIKRSVLIVDDEDGSRRVLSRLLLKRGHDSCAVATINEAIDLLPRRTFDLIVMDLIMPEGDGVTNIRRLRGQGVRSPILICTGQMDVEAINQGLEAGANGVIRKPFSAAQFIAKMDQCLE